MIIKITRNILQALTARLKKPSKSIANRCVRLVEAVQNAAENMKNEVVAFGKNAKDCWNEKCHLNCSTKEISNAAENAKGQFSILVVCGMAITKLCAMAHQTKWEAGYRRELPTIKSARWIDAFI